jgi:hypothetical protein
VSEEKREGPPVVRKLDFSQYHPLDHSVWECKGYPGGRRRHLAYRWDFQWRDRLRGQTLCRAGRHAPVQWWSKGGKAGVTCRGCYKDLEEDQGKDTHD